MEVIVIPKDTLYTKAFARAQESLGRSFELALDRTGRVPIGQQIIDKRTAAKNSGLGDVAGMQAIIAMDANALRQKEFKEGNHPKPTPTSQNPRVASGGKVVDPTAIESAQSADGISVDTSTGAGISNIPYSEGS